MSKPQLFLRSGELDGARGAEPCCPTCQTPVGAWAHVDADPLRAYVPKPGDMAVCAYCSSTSILILGPRGYALRPATEEERGQVRGALSLAETVQLTRAYQRRRQH